MHGGIESTSLKHPDLILYIKKYLPRIPTADDILICSPFFVLHVFPQKSHDKTESAKTSFLFCPGSGGASGYWIPSMFF